MHAPRNIMTMELLPCDHLECKLKLAFAHAVSQLGSPVSSKVLQGSVETRVNYDRIFIDSFTANLLQSVMVKEF